jgi:hypothetical protein
VASQDSIIATRAFKLYYDDYVSSNAMPADTVLYSTDPSGFTNVGWTVGGLSFGIDQTRNEIRVDQEFFPVANPLADVTITMGAELAEITPANLLSATGLGEIGSVASGVARGHDELVITSDFTETTRTWLARVLMPDNEAANIALWRGQATASVDMTITPDNPSTIGMEVTGLVDSAGTPTGRIATYRRVTPISA